MRASCPTTGAASARSRPLPWGMPSTMSTRTTSARPASAMRCAVVAPTLPAPITVTLLRAIGVSVLPDRVDVDRPGIADRLGHAVGILGEVVVEHPGDAPGRLIVGILV